MKKAKMKRALRTSAFAALFVGLFATAPVLAGDEQLGGSTQGRGKATPALDPSREVPFSKGAALESGTGLSQESMGPRADRTPEAGARAPLNQTGCTICMTGAASVTWSGSTGSFHVDTISNNRSSGTSGPLDLKVILTTTLPVFGQSVSYLNFSNSVSIPALAAGYYYSNVDSGTITFLGSSIPADEYFQLLYLRENVSGTFYYDDWIVMDQKVSCDGSGCSTISPPTANFTFSANPKAGQPVQFTDTSTGSPTSWSWNFGDSATSTSQNPSHTYAAAGTYQASLTASNVGGPNTKTQSVVVSAGGGGGGTTCTEDANTACLIGGRYKVTSHWKNQFNGGATANLFKAKLTDTTNAFWLFDAGTYECVIRVNTATDNARAWITILTFTTVEFWVDVTDTKSGQFKEYHSDPGNTTLIYDPTFFVYP